MKVLILKYALCLRARFAWLLTAFAAWLAASAAWPARLHSFSAAAVLFASLTPVWLDDDTNGFERYAASLPISRAELALSRYALGALCGAAAFVLELAVSAVLRWPLWELYRPALVALYIGCALLSLALPAAYKFGFAAARAACVPPLLAAIAVFAMLPSDWAKTPGAVLIAAPAAAVAAAWGSALSVGIYRKKEF